MKSFLFNREIDPDVKEKVTRYGEEGAVLAGKLEGALFYDVGNVWTIDNAAAPEGNIGKDFYKELAGLAGDTKPVAALATGSLFLEVDTGDVYAFDEAGAAWGKICALGGAGS